MLQCVAVCCSILQCVALCHSIMQCDVVCYNMLWCDACRRMPCVALCCSEAHAVCCSVLQCVALRRSRRDFTLQRTKQKKGELQRLEKQLLQELHDLKARGVHTVSAAAPQPVDDGQVRELRRELDRSSVENDRLRSEVDRLRRAPAPPAPAPVPAAAAGPCQNCEQKEGQVRDLQQQLQRSRTDLEQLREQLRVAKAAGANNAGAGSASANSGGGYCMYSI